MFLTNVLKILTITTILANKKKSKGNCKIRYKNVSVEELLEQMSYFHEKKQPSDLLFALLSIQLTGSAVFKRRTRPAKGSGHFQTLRKQQNKWRAIQSN